MRKKKLSKLDIQVLDMATKSLYDFCKDFKINSIQMGSMNLVPDKKLKMVMPEKKKK